MPATHTLPHLHNVSRSAVRALCAAATSGLLLAAPNAQALSFTLLNASAMSAQQLAPIQAAMAYWSSQISTDVNVVLDIGFSNLGSSTIIGQAGSSIQNVSYTSLHSALSASAGSSADASAYSTLGSGAAVGFYATNTSTGATFYNDNNSADNTVWQLTTAQAKALGYSTGGGSDATITFNSGFAFDYDRSDGTGSGLIDLQTVAEHEIAHALGFVSGVDDAAECRVNGGFGCSNTSFQNQAHYGVLDLFRYSSTSGGLLDLSVGTASYLSIDGGDTAITAFSTGVTASGGYQASHFGTAELTLMRPYLTYGSAYDAFAADLTAMDVIGWTLTSAVPEPASWALLLGGVAGLAGISRRRQPVPAQVQAQAQARA